MRLRYHRKGDIPDLLTRTPARRRMCHLPVSHRKTVMSQTLKIGWSQVDSTPDDPVSLYGQYYPRLSTSVHSPVSATALAMLKVEDADEDQDDQPNFEMELHSVRLGDAVFVTNPFELFLDYGHQIKARSGASQTFVVQLFCGYGRYLPTPQARKLGNYGGLIANGDVGSDGGKKLVDETVFAIGELFGAA